MLEIDYDSILNSGLDNYIVSDEAKTIAININPQKYEKVDFNKYELILNEKYYQIFKSFNRFNYKIDYLEDKKLYHLTLDDSFDKINTKEEYDLFIKKANILRRANKYHKPKLLMHCCCGPCSSECLVELNDYFDVDVFFYNPNIYPEEEYNKRLITLKELLDKMNSKSEVLTFDYDHSSYLKAIDGYNSIDYKEGSIRCYYCYEERMEELAKLAKSKKYDYFTTTLSISPYKNSDWINEIGNRLESKYDIKFLYSNFKLNNGYKNSIELSKKYNLYRQEYCGCEYSLKEMKEKAGFKK